MHLKNHGQLFSNNTFLETKEEQCFDVGVEVSFTAETTEFGCSLVTQISSAFPLALSFTNVSLVQSQVRLQPQA